jgi:hypothetical protein
MHCMRKVVGARCEARMRREKLARLSYARRPSAIMVYDAGYVRLAASTTLGVPPSMLCRVHTRASASALYQGDLRDASSGGCRIRY